MYLTLILNKNKKIPDIDNIINPSGEPVVSILVPEIRIY